MLQGVLMSHNICCMQLAGTFQERYEALPTGKIASYGALIGTVHIHPSTPFGLQCRGISMQEYWATVDDKKEDKDEEIVPKEEVSITMAELPVFELPCRETPPCILLCAYFLNCALVIGGRRSTQKEAQNR